jgi:hypothetical protein
MSKLYIKVKCILKNGLICKTSTYFVKNPAQSLLCKDFYDFVSRITHGSEHEIKNDYSLLYQPQASKELAGIAVDPKQSYMSMCVLNGANFLFVHRNVLGLSII